MNNNTAHRVSVRLIEVGAGAAMVQMAFTDGKAITDGVVGSRRSVMRKVTAVLRVDGYRPVARWSRDQLSLRAEWTREFAKGADLSALIANMVAELHLGELVAR